MYNTSLPLTDREAERLYTELKRRGLYAKLRELRDYTPEQISDSVGMAAKEIAKMAGRDDDERKAPRA